MSSSTNALGAPPNYFQATGSVYPSAPVDTVPTSTFNNPPYPTNQQLPYPNPYPAPGPVQGYQQPAAAGYPQPSMAPSGYNHPATAAAANSSYEAHKYTDEDHIVMSGDDVVAAGGWVGSSFSDKKLRQAFIRKVYLILMSQLCVTVGVVCIFVFCKPVKQWVQLNSWFYYCAYAVFLVTYFTLICCDSVRRRWPSNIICLAVFTLALSYMAGTISGFYDTQSIVVALGITAAVCLAISLFAVQTKIDFTMCTGLLFALVMCLFFFGFACMITYLAFGHNHILHCVYGGLAALVFSLFLVFDTQMVVGGQKRKYELSAEEHIYGALQLYIDIVYLFLILLGLFGGRSS